MARTDTASRLIAAGVDRVYAALVGREALLSWLPPQGMTAQFERFDAKPGGSYRMVLSYADPTGSHGKTTTDTDVVEARFVDLVPDVRVVQEVVFVSDDPAYAGTMTMTWQVTPVEDGTRVDVTAVNVPEGVTVEDHTAGITSSLANLAAFLER